jgi:hypothetical protein
MKLIARLALGCVIGLVIGGVVGLYGAVVNLPVELTAGIIGPLTAAVVAVVMLAD